MATRGRKSTASLSVAPVGIDHRLTPCAGLTQAQRAEWVKIVNSRPADWFGPEHESLLAQYCRHKVSAEVLSEQMEAFKPEWLIDDDGLKRYELLQKMMTRESNIIIALLRTMRITQQSMYNAKSANTAAEKTSKGRKLWHVED